MADEIHTTRGHLTAADKRSISYMIEHDMPSAKTKRKRYALTAPAESAGEWSVLTTWNERNDWGRMVERRSRDGFTIKRTN